MVFGEQDGEIFYSDTAWRYFIDKRNRYLFTSIDRAPLATYESTGPDDATAVFLNAMLYTPGDKTIEGEPPWKYPVGRAGMNLNPTSPWTPVDSPQDSRGMAGKGDPAQDRITSALDGPDDADIGFLFRTLTDEDIAIEAE